MYAPLAGDPASGGGRPVPAGILRLCHILGERYGPAARMILNYDFTYLAILLSDPEEAAPCRRRCVSSPVRLRAYQPATAALELAADESVILAYWQLGDGVEDHGLWKGLGYRVSAAALRGGYRKAAAPGRSLTAGCGNSWRL